MTFAAGHLSQPYTVTVSPFRDLQPADIADWRKLCAAHEDYDSALLTPEFAGIVAGVRDDVRIVMARRNGRLVAVLPFHMRPNGFGRPLGAPFADYSGPIVSADCELTLHDLLKQAKVGAYDSASVPDPFAVIRQGSPDHPSATATDSRLIRVNGPAASVLEAQRAQHAKRFKNFRRLRNQIEREAGPLTLDWGRPDPAKLLKLFEFKRDQYLESGYVDLTNAEQARTLLDAVARSEHGFMVSLRVGDALVSGHFGVRVGTAFHPWIAAYSPAYGHFSPGNVLLMAVLEQLDDIGLTNYDLANGHDHYKKYFANASRSAWPVFETGAGIAALEHKVARAAWQIAGAQSPRSPVGRLQRRLDQIAASEFSFVSRAREFAYAVRARSIPSKGREDTVA